jgi:hypothetical protein
VNLGHPPCQPSAPSSAHPLGRLQHGVTRHSAREEKKNKVLVRDVCHE